MKKIHVAETQASMASDVRDVWDKLRFYEQIEKSPPWLLRRTLPKPLRVVGDHMSPGGLSRCEYAGGEFILKRIVTAIECEELTFEVVEHGQGFRFVRLLGGTIRLESRGPGKTLISMSTRYSSSVRGFALLRPFVERVIRSLHRFVIADMAECLRQQHERTPVDIGATS